MDSSTPRLSVVIPSYQRIQQAADVVRLYLLQEPHEVVLVLDGLHADLGPIRELTSDPRLKLVLLDQNLGVSLARVAGLEHVTGDVVLIADDDVIPEADVIARHITWHREVPDLVVIGYMPVELPARRGADQAPTFLYAREYEKLLREWDQDPSLILGGLWFGTVSVTTSLYRRAEELKPSIDLRYNEDLDLGLRLEILGANVRFDRGIRALHLHQRGIDSYLKEADARGSAAATLEDRWGALPPQLQGLILASDTAVPPVSIVLRACLAVPESTAVRGLSIGYRITGRLRLWRSQELLVRVVRYTVAVRAYRRTRAEFAAQPG